MTRLSSGWCVPSVCLAALFWSAVAEKATARIKRLSHRRVPREECREGADRAEADRVEEGLLHRASSKS